MSHIPLAGRLHHSFIKILNKVAGNLLLHVLWANVMTESAPDWDQQTAPNTMLWNMCDVWLTVEASTPAGLRWRSTKNRHHS